MRYAAFVASVMMWFALNVSAAGAQALKKLDEHGESVDVLRGVATWARNPPGYGTTVLMRRIAGRTSRIPGVPVLTNYDSLDLGIDLAGRVVLVYDRCHGGICRGPYVVDVRRGGPRLLPLPRRRGCEPGRTASVWGDQIAYTQRCRGEGSGVYLVRGRRARLVQALSADRARNPGLDLNSRYLLLGSEVFSTERPRCRAAVPSRPGFSIDVIDAHADRVWWVRAIQGFDDESDTELVSAAVEPGCVIRPLGSLYPLPDVWSFRDSLAVAGSRFYIGALDAGISTGALPAGT